MLKHMKRVADRMQAETGVSCHVQVGVWSGGRVEPSWAFILDPSIVSSTGTIGVGQYGESIEDAAEQALAAWKEAKNGLRKEQQEGSSLLEGEDGVSPSGDVPLPDTQCEDDA